MKQKIFQYLFLSLALIFLVLPSLSAPGVVNAAGLVNCGNAELKDGETTLSDACTIGDLFNTVVGVTNFLIAFAGLIAIAMIVKGGFSLVISAGNPAGYASAKKTLFGAIGGLVLVFLAFVLVNTLISGSLELGIKNGVNIFKNPTGYIQGQ